jgi:hypothetical protein
MGKAAKLPAEDNNAWGLPEVGVGGAHSSNEGLERATEPRSPGVKQADSEKHGAD